MSAKEVLSMASADAGWNVDSMLNVACDYIDGQQKPEAFGEYVGGRVKAEVEATEDNTVETCSTCLLLICIEPPDDVIAGWTEEQRKLAIDYAGAVHLKASDNDDVQVPPKPDFLNEWEVDFQGNYIHRPGRPPAAEGEPIKIPVQDATPEPLKLGDKDVIIKIEPRKEHRWCELIRILDNKTWDYVILKVPDVDAGKFDDMLEVITLRLLAEGQNKNVIKFVESTSHLPDTDHRVIEAERDGVTVSYLQ